MPWLAALVCCSAFDVALHDAYGVLHNVPTYQTYNREFMSWGDLANYSGAERRAVRRPTTRPIFSARIRQSQLRHGISSAASIRSTADDLTGNEPNDGYPMLLEDWIWRDGLKCLKIKLRGNDAEWDYQRIFAVGNIALAKDVIGSAADFNCTVREPTYVNAMLDRLRDDHPRIYGMILYVEQPFPYELEEHRIDVHSVSARKPLFLDESAHDWRMYQARTRSRLDRCRPENLQDPDRRYPGRVLG